MPLGATPTTPGGYLLGEEAAREPGGRPVQPRPAPYGRDPGRRPVHHPEGCRPLRRACPSRPRPGGPEPRLPVGGPVELGVHHGGVHAGPVGGGCKVVLVDAVLQAVGDPAWEMRGAKDGACVWQPAGPRGARTGTGPPPRAHGPQAEWAPPVRSGSPSKLMDPQPRAGDLSSLVPAQTGRFRADGPTQDAHTPGRPPQRWAERHMSPQDREGASQTRRQEALRSGSAAWEHQALVALVSFRAPPRPPVPRPHGPRPPPPRAPPPRPRPQTDVAPCKSLGPPRLPCPTPCRTRPRPAHL